MGQPSKRKTIEKVISAYRESTSEEGAFDTLAAEKLGIGPTDLRCLDIVQARDGATAGEIAAHAGLTTGAVTGVVDRLERAGFARRVRDPSDRRKVHVEVTDLHYERSGAIWGPVMEEWLATLSREFTATELATVIRFLEVTTRMTADQARRLAG